MQTILAFPTENNGVLRSNLRYRMIRLLLMAGVAGMLAVAVMTIVAQPGAAPPLLD